jgi:Family of unknown function (DUF6152)
MQRIVFAFIFGSVVSVSSGYLYAHHSFAATYQEDKTAQIQGKLVQFTFRNPHSFLQIDSKDDDGKLIRWTVEWSGAGQLGDQGITRDSLRPGDELIITGNPGRNAEDHRMRMKSMQRTSDGLKWSGTVE